MYLKTPFFTVVALAFCAFFTAIPDAFAQQLRFQKQHRGHEHKFSYIWKDSYGQQQNLNFSLQAKLVDQARNEIKPFSNKELSAHVLKELQVYARQLQRSGHDVQIQPSYKGFNIRHRGLSASNLSQINQQIDTIAEEATNSYLSKSFYQKINEQNVMIDHKAVVSRYVSAMRPVAEAVAYSSGNMSARERLNYALSFLQSIPYDQLRSRYTANGAGFQTPYGLFYGNRGDCDTKAVALAALIRNLYPRNRVAIIYTPGHAFVGITGQQGYNDFALRLGGSTFVLMDPTGPGMLRVGQVGQDSAKSLQGGNFSYQEVSRR